MNKWKAEMPQVLYKYDGNCCREVDVCDLVADTNAELDWLREELAEVRAERDTALARVRELTEWRPMETAPQLEVLLILDQDDEVRTRFCGSDSSLIDMGWLPLPEKPKKSDKVEPA